MGGREREGRRRTWAQSSTAEPCTGTQEDAVGRRMDLGQPLEWLKMLQSHAAKPGSRNSSGGMSVTSYLVSGKARDIHENFAKNKMLCTTVIYNRAISLSSVALCKIAQLLS